MGKWVNVSEVNNIVGKALESCKGELSPSFYRGARLMLDKINEMAEETADTPQTDCETCKYGQDKHRYAHICNECGVGINNYTPQTGYEKGLQEFADLLFDKNKQEQFLKECKAMGIEPQTDCGWK